MFEFQGVCLYLSLFSCPFLNFVQRSVVNSRSEAPAKVICMEFLEDNPNITAK